VSGMTRPDFSFPVSMLCQFNKSPCYTHWRAALRLLQFVHTTKDYGIVFEVKSTQPNLHGFSDSDWSGSHLSGRSHTGYVCKITGPISWKAKAQSTTALSTTEAELIALSECGKEISFLRQVLAEFDQDITSRPSPIFEDNRATREVALKPGSYTRLRHVKIRHFYIQDLVKDKEVSIETVRSEEQAADLLTKIIDGSAFSRKAEQIGVFDLEKFLSANGTLPGTSGRGCEIKEN
jgi:hypothetical protein